MPRLLLPFLAGGLLLFLAFGLLRSAPPDATGQPPNVLFIAVDDLRPELGAYGAEHMVTPHLDALARSGTLFERAYCNVPVCGASRASLLTGLQPRPSRFLTHDTYVSEEGLGFPSLPEYFKRNGYHTVGYGKVFHEADDSPEAWSEPHWRPRMTLPEWASRHGYQLPENIEQNNCNGKKGPATERVDRPDSLYIDNWIARRTVTKLKELAATDRPFFLAAGFIKPHLPFVAPEKYWAPYDDLDIDPRPLPPPAGAPGRALHNWGELRSYPDIPRNGDVTDAKASELIHGYYAAVSFVDAQIGLVLDALEEAGLAENTIVIVWGDHGWSLREHSLWAKHSSFDVAMRSPLIMRHPGNSGAGSRVEALTQFVDIYPTLCELAELPLPDHLQGESFADCLDGNCDGRDTIYARYRDQDIIKTDSFLYTEWYNNQGRVIDRMLYNHAEDPRETVNVAERPEYAELIEGYHQRIQVERAGE